MKKDEMKEALREILSEREFVEILNRVEAALYWPRLKRVPKRDLHNVMWERAIEQSADFVEKNLRTAVIFKDKMQIWDYAVRNLNEHFLNGVCLEFGVAVGTSVNWFSSSLPEFSFIGFDSFIGLKEDWVGHHALKGDYSQNGILPDVNSNVRLVPGWFDQTISKYIQDNVRDLNDLRFIHIDGDTYESAVAVFDALGSYLKPGIFVLFDEMIGYPNWQNGEVKALEEAKKKFNFDFKYRAFAQERALIEII